MLVIKGTDKIKGILDLGDVGLQLKTNDEYSLSEQQFYQHSVQVAIKMGLVTYSQNSVPDPEADMTVQLRNVYDRTITVNAIGSDVRPGQVFGISEEALNSPDIQGALAKGILEVVSSVRSSNPLIEETDVKVGELFESTNEPEETITAESLEKEATYLETNEELSAPNVIEDDNPAPIVKKDIPDPKGKSVVWNPNREPIPHTASRMDAVDARGLNLDNPLIETDVSISDEISFVDQELNEKRLRSHPILKDKPAPESNDLDFV